MFGFNRNDIKKPNRKKKLKLKTKEKHKYESGLTPQAW